MKKLLLTVCMVLFTFLSGFSYTIYWFGGVFYQVSFPSSIPRTAPDLTDGANDFTVGDVSCNLTSDAQVKSLLVSSGDLTISNSATVTINENAVINSGTTVTIENGATLIVTSSISNSGTIIVNTGGNLIQSGTGSATGSGYQINASGYSSADRLNYWSSPVSSANLASTFSGAEQCDIYYLNASSQVWTRDIGSSTCEPVAPASGDGNMDIGRGYMIAGGSSPTFTGTINTGTINEGITASGVTSPDWTGTDWNLIGNPYPSSIDGTSFLASNGAGVISGTLYFWSDDNTAGTGYGATDYATWNLGGGTGASGGGSSTVPNGSIPVGQGFIVQASATTNVVFNNAMRGGNNSQFFKTEKEDISRLWISADHVGRANSQILIAFTESATENEDWGYDSKKLPLGNQFIFGSMLGTGTEPYAIQSFSKLDLETRRDVPLTIYSENSGVTKFQIDNTENLDTDINIFLYDKITGKHQNLSNGPYAVYLNANQQYANRFSLQIINSNAPDPLGIQDSDISNLNITCIDKSLFINDQAMINTVEVFSITGTRMVNSKENSFECTLDLSSLSDGVYVIKVVKQNGQIESKKFILR